MCSSEENNNLKRETRNVEKQNFTKEMVKLKELKMIYSSRGISLQVRYFVLK